jgi:hypothetical protein
MMQTSEVWGGHDTVNGLHSTRRWCILVQRKVRASIVVISLVRSQQMAKMPLAEDKGAESLSEFDPEMQWFESCRPNRPVAARC